MKDIVIYMSPKDFKHKTSPRVYAYWHMSRYPKDFTVENKIYIAAYGRVQGYVECEEFNPDGSEETIVWNADTYIRIQSRIPVLAFRGFRYKWW